MKRTVLCLAFFASLTFADRVCAQVTQTYAYDGHGRLIEVVTTGSGGTNTATYAYDHANNRTQRVRSGTTSYAALETLPDGGVLSPGEALVSPDGRFALAMRETGQLELWREDERIWSIADLPQPPAVVADSLGATVTLAARPTTEAVWSVTDDGALVATSQNGSTTLWSSADSL